MRRLAATLLLAIALPAGADEPIPLPTAPQVPPPMWDVGRNKGGGTRGWLLLTAGPCETCGSPFPLPTGYRAPVAAAPVAATPVAATPVSVASESGHPALLQKLKAWFTFQPTTRDALPKFDPHPYVGPVVGTFSCGSGPLVGGDLADGRAGHGGCGAGGRFGAGCGDGGESGRAGLFQQRFGRGPCIPPADDAFPGYRFANHENPAVGGSPLFGGKLRTTPEVIAGPFPYPMPYPVPHSADLAPGSSPARPVTGVVKPSGATTDPVKRPFTRP